MLNRSSRVRLLAMLLLFFSAISACYYDNEEILYGKEVDCSQVTAKFAADVLPIIQSKCAYSGCHDAGAAGGLNLTSYNLIFQNASRIRTAVVVTKTMPKSGSITPAELARLKCWLDSGAPDN